jgi:ferredoxin
MMQLEKVNQALAAIEAACGHCEICSPVCPVAVARRAMQGLQHDLAEYEKCQTGK